MNKDTNNCSGCDQKDRCGLAFEKLGKSKGPNVVWNVIVAFLTPILVFILSLAGSNKFLEDQFQGNMLTIVTFSAAMVITLLVIVLIRAVRRPIK